MAKPKKPPPAGQYHLGGVVLLRRAIRNRRGQELPEGACVLIIEVKDERRRVERRDGVRVVCDVKDLRPLTDERSGTKDDAITAYYTDKKQRGQPPPMPRR